MHCEEKLKSRSYNTSYCLIEVAAKAGLSVPPDKFNICFILISNMTCLDDYQWQ